MTPLEEAILAAAEAGDYQLLRQLQARYRQSAVITSSARGPAVAVRLAGTKTASSKASRSPKPRPSWHLEPTPGQRATRPTPVELREAAPAHCEVVVEPGARRAMRDEVWLYLTELRNGLEVGGWLLGFAERGIVRVVAATGPGERGELEPDGVLLDERAAFDLERELAEIHDRPEVQFCGAWHTHRTRSASPSEQDRLTAFKKLSGLRYVGRSLDQFVLLITPVDERGEPDFRPAEGAAAWAVLPERLCLPAALRKRGS